MARIIEIYHSLHKAGHAHAHAHAHTIAQMFHYHSLHLLKNLVLTALSLSQPALQLTPLNEVALNRSVVYLNVLEFPRIVWTVYTVLTFMSC
jgi:hypothetical protein